MLWNHFHYTVAYVDYRNFSDSQAETTWREIPLRVAGNGMRPSVLLRTALAAPQHGNTKRPAASVWLNIWNGVMTLEWSPVSYPYC